MTHEPDDFSFLDALEETDALGDLLGETKSETPSQVDGGTGATSSESSPAGEAPAHDSRDVYERPMSAVLCAMPWTGSPKGASTEDTRDASASSPAAPTSAPTKDSSQKGDLGENYLQSISW